MHNSTTGGPRSNTFAMVDAKPDIVSLQHRAAIWATRSQGWLDSFAVKNIRRLVLGSFWLRAVMEGGKHKVAIDNLTKQGDMRRFGKHDVKLVATRKEREQAIKYQALLKKEGMEDGSGPGSLTGAPLAYWLSLRTATFAIMFG
jgi:hypothetical protein